MNFDLEIAKEKNKSSMLKLLPKSAIYYFCKANIPRGLDSKKLKKKAANFNLLGENYSTVKQALLNANKNAKNNDLIFIGGSTFVVAEIL